MEYDLKTSEFYSQNASSLAEEYSKASPGFTEILKNLLPKGALILDAGCGTGRDLAELINAGFEITGTDAAAEMLLVAEKMYPQLSGRLIRSTLPELKGIPGSFNGLLCSGVLQHVGHSQIELCFETFSRLLDINGILLISFPLSYPGVNPETGRDAKGRVFNIRTAQEYKDFSETNSFELIHEKTEKDALKRRQVSWSLQVYRKTGKEDG